MNDISHILTKILWAVGRPSALLLLLLLAGVALTWTPWRNAGRRLAAAAATLLLLLSTLPIDAWLAWPLENRFPHPKVAPARVDGIVVLGGAVDPSITEQRGLPALNEAAERMTAFVTLARRYPQARLVFAGGYGGLRPGNLSESDVARRLFADLGLDPGRVTFEGESRNTYENALFAHRLTAPQPDETWLLVTSALHMPRAVGAFRQVGWAVTPWPVGYKTGEVAKPGWLDLPTHAARVDMAVHEWVGLAAYRLSGRSEPLFPGPNRVKDPASIQARNGN